MHLITTHSLTMTSLEISKLVEQRHDNVKRTIETLGGKGVVALPQIEEVPNDGPGPKTISVYNLRKRDSLIVVAQLCPEFTARIVDRWQALEELAAKPTLNPANLSRLQLIELAMQAEQERLVLEDQVGVMAPKVAAFDRIATADGSLCLTDAAKELQIRPKDFIGWLSCNGWIYKRAGCSNWIGYQDRIQSGLLEHKSNIVIDAGGNERIRDQVRVTAKGLARLATVLEAAAA